MGTPALITTGLFSELVPKAHKVIDKFEKSFKSCIFHLSINSLGLIKGFSQKIPFL
jgi:hypothetical protein